MLSLRKKREPAHRLGGPPSPEVTPGKGIGLLAEKAIKRIGVLGIKDLDELPAGQ